MDNTYMKYPEIVKSRDPWMPVTGVRAELGPTADGFGVSFWGDETILKFNWKFPPLYEYTKRTDLCSVNRWILQYVNYITLNLSFKN